MGDDQSYNERAVGYLFFIRTDKPDSFTDIPIEANAQVNIGRQEVSDALDLNEMNISTNHLRFHCVMYGDDEAEKVPPLVYVRVLSSNPVLFTQTGLIGGNSTCHLTKDQPDVLLNHGDSLKLTPKVLLEYSALYDNAGPRRELDSAHQLETKSFAEKYTVTPRKLGSGGYASVYLAINRKDRRQVACKIVPLPELPPLPDTPGYQVYQRRMKTAGRTAVEKAAAHRKKLQELRREFDILRKLDHPNIIRLEKAIYSIDHVYIFQELLTGGDLLSYLEMKQGLEQPEAAMIIFQLLKAVDYLHDNGVVHRDIKPENVLMTSWRTGDRVVLVDFGQSRSLSNDNNPVDETAVFRMQSVIGTLGYTAPEVKRQMHRTADPVQGYSKAIDIWSIGCLTATLFTNQFLFLEDADGYAPPDPDIPVAATQYNLAFLDTRDAWKGISGKAKSFIRDCVVVNEDRRLTAKQAIKHKFLNHPSYAPDIQTAYGRAIANWEPRKNPPSLIEHRRPTGSSVTDANQRYDARLHEEVKSKHFSTGVSAAPQFRDFAPFSEFTRQRHTPLSPLETNNDVAMSDINQWTSGRKRTQSKTDGKAGNMKNSKTAAPEESCLSIQDFAPPSTQPTLTGFDASRDTHASQWLVSSESLTFRDDFPPKQKKART